LDRERVNLQPSDGTYGGWSEQCPQQRRQPDAAFGQVVVGQQRPPRLVLDEVAEPELETDRQGDPCGTD